MFFAQFWTSDHDYNRIPDKLTFQFTLAIPSIDITNLDLYLGLESHLNDSTHCHFKIPSAIIVRRQLNVPAADGQQLIIAGHLVLKQKFAFHCPFFMRDQRSHFYTDLVPPPLDANLRDYRMRNIQNRLRDNVGYLELEIDDIYWTQAATTSDAVGADRRTQISVLVDVGEVSVRYRTTIWQMVHIFWVYYVSVVLVFMAIIDRLKNWMFRRQLIRAWEIVPWKKLY